MSSPQIWAHRGASSLAPENTMEAFEKAIELGADGIELDVQLSKDGQLVVIHDETIDRVSDGTGFVREYTYEELKRFSYSRLHPEYKNVRIPSLEEVYELIKPTTLTLNVELKTNQYPYTGIEEKTWKLTEAFRMQEQVIFSSFNFVSLQRLKIISAKVQVGFLYKTGPINLPQYAEYYGIEALHPHYSVLKSEEFVEDCKKKRIKLHVWTVNQEKQMKRCVEMGVDAVITDYVDKIKNY